MMDNNSLDLPPEIIEKLRNLELELEDGDITQKGFEKKKASLLAEITTTTEKPKSEAEILAELGPEPSAADVVDFLDYLPSPTHSPTRTVEAVNYMEENHRQIQQQQQQQTPPVQQLQQPVYQQQQPVYQEYQQSYYNPQQQQQQPMRPMQQPQYRSYPANNGPYYASTNNRPYMVQRPPPPPQGYYGQRPPPQNMMYRPQYTQQQQQQTSPRPMYRPRPVNYRPQQPQQQQYQQQQQQYYNPNPNNINRSMSTNMARYDPQQRQ